MTEDNNFVGLDEMPEKAPVKTDKAIPRPKLDDLYDEPVELNELPKPNKRQKKQMEKERLKQAKINEAKEKRKWSTYFNEFVLAEGENVIKEYNCLKLINPSGNGVITVTNKRLLCTTNELAETELENITGIVSKYKSKFSFLKVLLFVLVGGLGAACFMAANNIVIDLDSLWVSMPDWFNIILYVVGSIAGLISLYSIFTISRKEFHIQIYTRSSSAFVSYRGIIGRSKPTVIRVRPGKESRYIVHELGAVILEAKTGKFD